MAYKSLSGTTVYLVSLSSLIINFPSKGEGNGSHKERDSRDRHSSRWGRYTDRFDLRFLRRDTGRRDTGQGL